MLVFDPVESHKRNIPVTLYNLPERIKAVIFHDVGVLESNFNEGRLKSTHLRAQNAYVATLATHSSRDVCTSG